MGWNGVGQRGNFKYGDQGSLWGLNNEKEASSQLKPGESILGEENNKAKEYLRTTKTSSAARKVIIVGVRGAKGRIIWASQTTERVGFYSRWNEKALEGFNQESSMIWFVLNCERPFCGEWTPGEQEWKLLVGRLDSSERWAQRGDVGG